MDKSRVESTIFFIEKISFSLKLFSDHFYGQSFVKTVRGPLVLSMLHGNMSIVIQLHHINPLGVSIQAN